MPKTLAPIDDGFFDTAALILPVTIELPNSPVQVWAALAGDEALRTPELTAGRAFTLVKQFRPSPLKHAAIV